MSATDPTSAEIYAASLDAAPEATNLNSATAAPAATSTTIVAARPTRKRVTILNIGGLTVFVGETTATTSMAPLHPGASITLSSPALIAGITAAGTGSVAFWDEYD